VSTCTLPGVGALTGFHNHRGVSTLGPHAQPLAHLDRGPGNHPATADEGAVSDASGPGVVASYLHGPVLARNPALADHLLTRALGAPLPELDPERLPDLPALRRTYLDRAAPSRDVPAPARSHRGSHRAHMRPDLP
jgi:CobQ-like glutamine amidotransferase family enzyme